MKRIRMAWCALRGGHVLKPRAYVGQFKDLLLDCTRCDWSLLIVKHASPPVGRTVRFISIDEVTEANHPCSRCGRMYHLLYAADRCCADTVMDDICPDCREPRANHDLYKDGRCPVLRLDVKGQPPFPR